MQNKLQDPVEREKQNERMKEYYARPEVKEKLRSEEHLERARLANKKCRERNPEKTRENNRRAQRKYVQKSKNKISQRVSSLMRQSLKRKGGSKRGSHWEDLVDYSREDLVRHLESLWEPGMSWDNYGRDGWSIDHIIPISRFDFDSESDVGFKECWALSNLMPRWFTTTIAEAHGSSQVGNANKHTRIL
jgi:5-methylcytosine-specific restriction endonuclease McrA